MPRFFVTADITTTEHLEVDADNAEDAKVVAMAELVALGHDEMDVSIEAGDIEQDTSEADAEAEPCAVCGWDTGHSTACTAR